MASKYGVNYKAKFVTVPESKIHQGEQRGRVRLAYDKYDLSVDAATVATTDVIYMQKIPAGARVIDAWLKFGDLGTTGTCDIGWQASSAGGETADADGLFAAVDMKTAADALVGMNSVASPPAMFHLFTEEVQCVIVFSEATTATTGTIELGILYVID